ncbi:hypothetical protein C8Q70DRAFT_1034440 [Cubamyces menziesii]|nr:hypothetical protein C8Q70DRAFT_1034440 [Cubamyces menziesii]
MSSDCWMRRTTWARTAGSHTSGIVVSRGPCNTLTTAMDAVCHAAMTLPETISRMQVLCQR